MSQEGFRQAQHQNCPGEEDPREMAYSTRTPGLKADQSQNTPPPSGGRPGGRGPGIAGTPGGQQAQGQAPPPITLAQVRRPTDHELSAKLEALIPEAKLYRDLCEAEKAIDALISRKKLDLQDSLTSNARQTKTLRVFVSNATTDQPWQTMDTSLESNLFDFDTGITPSWNLRIEGRLVDDEPADSPTRPRFSSFISSIVVDIDRPQDMYPEGNVVEWHRPKPMPNVKPVEFDGLDIKRKGDSDVDVKIMLHMNEFPDNYRLSPGLADLLALNEATKPTVIMALWQYVKFHNLQDLDEKRTIICDDGLKRLFGLERLAFPQIIELVNPHLLPVDPIVINYKVRVDKPRHMDSHAYDIQVEVDDPMRLEMAKILENWYSDRQELILADQTIDATVQAINASKLKRDFFAQFSQDPAGFVNRWMSCQSKDLKTIMGDKEFNQEEIRRSDFYKKANLDESIFLFLNRPATGSL